MTGSELAATIRTERPDLPVIIATGFAELVTEVAAKYPTLSKPFQQRDLADVISATMESAGGGAIRS
jgi:FixJ family two-component response regulator